MNWDNLADNRCPRCGCKMESHGMLSEFRTCTDPHCLYKIREDKFAELSGKMRTRRESNYDPDANLSALNNL